MSDSRNRLRRLDPPHRCIVQQFSPAVHMRSARAAAARSGLRCLEHLDELERAPALIEVIHSPARTSLRYRVVE
ncbi:MAG TPA: hypothetical protein VF276_19085 [Chloroflexia bacterium]